MALEGPPLPPPSMRVPSVHDWHAALGAFEDHLTTLFGGHVRRVTCTRAGDKANSVKGNETGESAESGHDYPVLIHYTSATFGAAGGPQANDDMYVIDLGNGQHLVWAALRYVT